MAEKGARARERWRREILDSLCRRDIVLPAQLSFGELLDEFERRHVRTQKISASTAAKYSSLIKNHCRVLATRALAEFNPRMMQDWLDGRKVGYEAKKDLINLMRCIWERADEWNLWQERNPARSLDPGRKRSVYEKRMLTIEETRLLLASLHQDVRLCCEIALYGTLRISEVLGLQERHVDYVAGRLHVMQRYWRGDVDETKTEKSARVVPLGHLIDELRRRRTGNPDAWLISIRTKPNQKIPRFTRDDRSIRRYFLKPAAKALGLDSPGFGFHSFRREAITRLGQELAPAQMQAMAGHTDAAMQRRYTLADFEAQEKAVRNFQDAVMGESKGGVN